MGGSGWIGLRKYLISLGEIFLQRERPGGLVGWIRVDQRVDHGRFEVFSWSGTTPHVDVAWTYELRGDQRANPVVHSEIVSLPDGFVCPTDEELLRVFRPKGHQLVTWGRTPGVRVNDPHWIGVRGTTPLHIDPGYPRYSHQLKVRVDPGIYAQGISREAIRLRRGLYYVLDTHSPHQVFRENRGAGMYNISLSIDHDDVLPAGETIERLLAYGS